MPRLTLGVMGHVDHGKTALVRALTGTDTDRLPEEKRRGISIALGFAHLEIGGTEVDLIDMPGHERFVRTMVSGATGVGAALLVVAANEGVKPQTLEHLQIAALLGLSQVVAVVSKCDLTTEAERRARADEVAALLARYGLSAQPPVLASARTGEGLDHVRDQIAALPFAPIGSLDDGFPYLPIDRAFTLPGHGVIVTGTLRRGGLSADMALAVTASGQAVRVRGLQVHGAAVDCAEPGQRVAVNLRGAEPAAVKPGSALTRPGLLAPAMWLDVALRSALDAPALADGMRLQLLFGTTETPVRLRLLDRPALLPGGEALAQLQCSTPVFTPAREALILRVASPTATVAGGRVLDPASQRRRRRDGAVVERLRALAAADPLRIAAEEIARAGEGGVSLSRLAQLCGVAPERAAAMAHGAVELGGELVVGQAALERACARVLQVLADQVERQPNGLARRRLEPLMPGASPAVLDAAVARLAQAGRLRQDGGLLRPPARPDEKAARMRMEAALAVDLAQAFREGGLTPPDLERAAPTAPLRRALEGLVRQGVIVKTFDRVQKREILFHCEAVDQAKARLGPVLDPPGLLVAEAGKVLGVSRKYSVPLLEYLDALRFTRRMGDRRVLGPAARV